MTRRLVTPLLAAVFVLAAGSHGASTQQPSAPEAAATRARQVLAALEYGNVDAARMYMIQDPVVVAQVIANLENPRGTAAKTAYQVRRQALDLVLDDLAKAVQSDERVRGKMLSLEVGGTAGAQERAQRPTTPGGPTDAPGFTEKYADLDFQFRTTDPESARIVAEHAERILGRVPKELGIHSFPAAQTPQVATNTRDLNRIQTDQFDAAERRRTDKEAAAGDAMHATELDTYNRGVAYEIDPRTGQRARTSIDLDAFYDRQNLQAPSYTPDDAFSVTVNERGKFNELSDPSSAKRVTRAADALAMADYSAITPADREVIDLAGKINKTRSPAAAIESLETSHPTRMEYDRLVAKGTSPAAAAVMALEPVTRRAQGLLDKAVEKSLDAKLAAIDQVTGMSDAAIVDDLRTRAKQGDPTAGRFMEQYDRTRRGDRVELVKAARESMVETRKIALAETFSKMKPDARTRLSTDPRWSGNSHVQNLAALAEVWNDKALGQLSGEMTNELRRKGAADGDGPGGAVVPESTFGKALNQFDKAMFWMAMAGSLADAWQKRNEALANDGPEVARAVFVEQVTKQATSLGLGLAAAAAVEKLGVVLAEAGFPIVRSLITGVGTGMTVLGIADVTKAVGDMAWRYAQEPLLRAYLNPTGPISFYQVLKARPETLRADVLAYAKAHNLPTGPHSTRETLAAMAKDYFGRSGVPGAHMEGMADRLVEMLVVHEDRSYDYLSRVSDAITRDLMRPKGVPGTTDRRPASTRPAVTEVSSAEAAGEKDGPSDAEKAARRARERRKARARDRAARDEEWKQLQQEGQVENEVRRERADEARVRQDAEARLRREAEAQRKAEEAALFEAVQIDIGVPPALQPGGQGTVSVQVRAPQWIRLAGRRVAIRASPGHTDDGSMPLSAGGRGQTVYSAPADYNGYVRVTASLEGLGQVSRTFLVGKAVAEAPPEQKIENPKQVTLPETPDPVTIIEIAPSIEAHFRLTDPAGRTESSHDSNSETHTGTWTKTTREPTP